MRHINIEHLEVQLTAAWKKAAREAYQKASCAIPGKERNDAINSCHSVWRDLKDNLKLLSHNKCWYCETSTHRIIGDVDHHRPKNRVRHYPPDNGVPDLPGYWWLAFEWRNFRFSCEMCNRRTTDATTDLAGGKADHFPLLDSAKRIHDECDYEDLWTEEPLLLDPTDPDDPTLITFDIYDGTAKPICDDKSTNDYKRAKISIELYHLNQSQLKTIRHKDVCFEVYKLVEEMDKYLLKYYKNRQDSHARATIKKITTKLRCMIDETAQYSAAALAALKFLRNPERKWIEKLVWNEKII